MKLSRKLKFSMMLTASVVLMSMSSNYEDDPDGKAGHNGSPGEQTCAKSSCHDSFAVNSGIGSVSITAPGMTNWQYVPGQTYTINVTVAHSNKPLFGFGFEALLGTGANAGTLTAGTGSQALNATVSGNSRRTITHLENSGLVNGSKTWSFTWVAPANGANVTFYAAGNAANNSSSDSGDYIYTTSQAVTAVVVPSAPTIANAGSTLLCNGATTTLSVPSQTGVNFTWFDANDNQVGTGTSFVASQTGCYHVIASSPGGNANSTNTICITSSSVNADFSGLDLEYCSGDGNVVLTPIVSGGTFSGMGVSGNSFSPANAGPGNHDIAYTVTNGDGCTSTIIKEVVVNESVSASFSLSQNTICRGTGNVDLIPVDAGGTFSGNNVTGSQFDSNIDPGVYEITYVNGAGSCSESQSLGVTVLASPDASFTGLPEEICSDVPAFPLFPSVTGGFFSGNGISTLVFDPALASIGENLISYQISGANGCSATSSQTVVVNQNVDPAFVSSVNEICANGDLVLLIPDAAGGIFSGDGVTENSFDPSIGAGEYQITHTIGEGSCETSDVRTIMVLSLPDAGFSGLQNGYCANAEMVELTPVTSGGSFSGAGVTDAVFDPAIPEPGITTISYSVSGENGCIAVSSFDVVILASANSNFSGLPEHVCIDQDVITLNAESPGGVFIGNGITGEVFSPELAGEGEHIIAYNLDLVGCSSITSDTITVNGLPELSVSGLNPEYCLDDEVAALTPNQSGAILTGNGIMDFVFDPADAGVGSHVITCSFTDSLGCQASWTAETIVKALPSSSLSLNNITLTAEQDNAVYAWFDCESNQQINGADQQSFVPVVNSSYSVQISQNGCSVMSECIEVIVISVDENVSSDVLVYPNPASDFLQVKLAVPALASIYSSEGKLVYQSKLNSGLNRIELNEIQGGIYDVIISGDDLNSHHKLYIGNK